MVENSPFCERQNWQGGITRTQCRIIDDWNASEIGELGKRYKSKALTYAANDLFDPESGSEGEEEEEKPAEKVEKKTVAKPVAAVNK